MAGAEAAQKKPVTLEVVAATRVSDAPGPVLWAPDGQQFLYEQAQSLHLYDLNTRSSRALLKMSELEKAAVQPAPQAAFDWTNRRVRQPRVQWAETGKDILLNVRGDVFMFNLAAGSWVQITATNEAERDPKLSPDGRWVSFRRGRDLYVMNVQSRKVNRLTSDGSATRWNAELDWVYPEELDLGTAYWWSPDSSRIAYLQFDVSRQMVYPHGDVQKLRPVGEPQRYPQAGTPNADVRLGVVETSGGKTRWLDVGKPEERLIARVQWLPDSGTLAVQRLNRVQNRLDLLLVPARGGAVRTLLTETSAAWVNIHDDLRFLRRSPQILWASERTGFKHLYVISMEGQVVRQLTSGEWEVSEVAGIDEAAGRVFFVSTEASPMERRLYSVPLAGGERQLLTPEPGTHQISMSPSGQHYHASHSNLTSPPRRTLHAANGSLWANFHEADRKQMEEYAILPTELIQFKASDGALLYSRLIRPAGFQPNRKYPAVVMVYGGPHAQSVRNSWRGADWDQALAHRGFVIWQVDNRGSAGRGHVWEAPLYRRFGDRELSDQLDGVRHLVSLGFVDPERIGIYGWSYGGFMTLYAMLHAPDIFRAGIAGAPVTDWRNYDTIYTERYLGLPSENEEGYRLSSPVHFADRLKGQLLLVHNFQDDNVLFQHTLRMGDELQKAGKPFELMIYPQKTHGVVGPARRHMLETTTAFLERHLKQ